MIYSLSLSPASEQAQMASSGCPMSARARPPVRPSDITTSDYPTLLSSSSPMQTHARDPSAPRCAAAFARSPPFAKWSAGLCPPLFIVIFIASRSPPSATLVAKKPTASSANSSLENRQCDMQYIIGRATRVFSIEVLDILSDG